MWQWKRVRPGWLAVNSTAARAVEGHDDGVLDEAAGGLAVEVDEFELVAMQV